MGGEGLGVNFFLLSCLFFSFILKEKMCPWEMFLHHFMMNSDTSESDIKFVETASTHMLSRFGQLSSSGCQNFSKSVLQEHLASFWTLQCNIFTVLSWFIYFIKFSFHAYDRLAIIRKLSLMFVDQEAVLQRKGNLMLSHCFCLLGNICLSCYQMWFPGLC